MQAVKLHLGCGQNIINGWTNVDIQGGPNVAQMDLRFRLPIHDNTVSFIFNEHFIEHIDLDEGRRLMNECLRILKPGGIMRISTPDLSHLVNQYQDALQNKGPLIRFPGVWEPSTPAQMLNEGMRLWSHQFVYDQADLFTLLNDVGFDQITSVPWRVSQTPELANLECRPYNYELIVEARKPA